MRDVGLGGNEMFGEQKAWEWVTAENIQERPFGLLWLLTVSKDSYSEEVLPGVYPKFLLLSKLILSSFVGLGSFIQLLTVLASNAPLLLVSECYDHHMFVSQVSVIPFQPQSPEPCHSFQFCTSICLSKAQFTL